MECVYVHLRQDGKTKSNTGYLSTYSTTPHNHSTLSRKATFVSSAAGAGGKRNRQQTTYGGAPGGRESPIGCVDWVCASQGQIKPPHPRN